MHLHTTTFIHILATTAATHSPADARQVCTPGTHFRRLHSTPPLLHTYTHTHTPSLFALLPSPRGLQLWSVQNADRNKFQMVTAPACIKTLSLGPWLDHGKDAQELAELPLPRCMRRASSFPGLLFLTWQLVNTERAKGGAYNVAQDCTMSHLACSDLVLWGKVRLVESSQVLQEPRLGIPRPWEFLSACTWRVGGWGFSICPSRFTLHCLYSPLCPERCTSMAFFNRFYWCFSQWGTLAGKLRTGAEHSGVLSPPYASLPSYGLSGTVSLCRKP